MKANQDWWVPPTHATVVCKTARNQELMMFDDTTCFLLWHFLLPLELSVSLHGFFYLWLVGEVCNLSTLPKTMRLLRQLIVCVNTNVRKTAQTIVGNNVVLTTWQLILKKWTRSRVTNARSKVTRSMHFPDLRCSTSRTVYQVLRIKTLKSRSVRRQSASDSRCNVFGSAPSFNMAEDRLLGMVQF